MQPPKSSSGLCKRRATNHAELPSLPELRPCDSSCRIPEGCHARFVEWIPPRKSPLDLEHTHVPTCTASFVETEEKRSRSVLTNLDGILPLETFPSVPTPSRWRKNDLESTRTQKIDLSSRNRQACATAEGSRYGVLMSPLPKCYTDEMFKSACRGLIRLFRRAISLTQDLGIFSAALNQPLLFAQQL